MAPGRGRPVTEGAHTTYKWVDIDTLDGRAVWVAAVFLTGGKDNYPHPEVPVHDTGEGEYPPILG